MRLHCSHHGTSAKKFQSTHSLRSATKSALREARTLPVSIHALLAECDCQHVRGGYETTSFNPRTPCGVRLHSKIPFGGYGRFNPRTPCGVRQYNVKLFSSKGGFQSTHSLRSATGPNEDTIQNQISFNPRTPCGVRREPIKNRSCPRMFQSTHSLRSATHDAGPGGESLGVSIHALLAECD